MALLQETPDDDDNSAQSWHAGECRGLRMTADNSGFAGKCHYELINGIVTMSPSPSMHL